MQASPDNSIPQELQCDFATNSQHIAQAMLAIANIYEAVVFAAVFQINCLVFLEGGGVGVLSLFSFHLRILEGSHFHLVYNFGR